MRKQESQIDGHHNYLNEQYNQDCMMRDRPNYIDRYANEDSELISRKEMDKRLSSDFSLRIEDLNQSKPDHDSINHSRVVIQKNDNYFSRNLTPSKESDKDEGSRISKHGRKQNFSKEATSIMKKWLLEHVEHPYLKTADKVALSRESGLTKKQVQNWFTNVRKRIWQPLMNKFRNKRDLKKIILKLKLKLDSSDESSFNEELSSHQMREAQIMQRGEDLVSATPSDEKIPRLYESIIGLTMYRTIKQGKRTQRSFDESTLNQYQLSSRIDNVGDHRNNQAEEEEKQININQDQFPINLKRAKNKIKDLPDDGKVTKYLQDMDKFNQKQMEKRANNINSENGSNGSNNGQENNSGSGGGSNLAYLDSSTGYKNISGTGLSHAPGSGSGGNSTVQYVPIFIVACPNLLKNEPCFCGHQQSQTMPANFQLHQLFNIMQNPAQNNPNTSSGSSNSQYIQPNNMGQGISWLSGSTLSTLNNNNNGGEQQVNMQLPLSGINQNSHHRIHHHSSQQQNAMNQQQQNMQQPVYNNVYFPPQNNFKSQIPTQMNPFQTLCQSSESSGNSLVNHKDQIPQSKYWNIKFPNVHLPKPSISQIGSLSNDSNGSNGSK